MDAPDRRLLTDSAGRVMLSYLPASGVEGADDVRPLADVHDVAAVLLEQLPGWVVATEDTELAEALLAVGSRQVRFSHLFSRDLVADPPDPTWLEPVLAPGVLLRPDGVPLLEQGQLSVRAYPHGHTDHDGDDPEYAASQLARLYGGDYIGPVLDCSTLAMDGDRLVGVLIVNRMPGAAPMGGPWVSEVFRDPHPRYVGLGTALIHRAMARLAAQHEATLSLVVTDANPARSLYERLGFQFQASSRKVRLPQ